MYGTAPLWQANIATGKTLQMADYHYIITDHLGTPTMTVNKEGQVTWQALTEAFGKTMPSAQNQITMNLRFPGQYYDQETGTHYNYFRDYNPQTGRYIQRDPIGLNGGINVYLYSEVNPLHRIDLLGLKPDINYSPNSKIPGQGRLTEHQFDNRIPDNPSSITVTGHSNQKQFAIYDVSGRNRIGVTADYVANDIRNTDRWRNGERNILLYACNTAKESDNIARDLAIELGANVTGMDGYFIHYDDGSLVGFPSIDRSIMQDYINRISNGEQPIASDYAYWVTYDANGNEVNRERAQLPTPEQLVGSCGGCYLP